MDKKVDKMEDEKVPTAAPQKSKLPMLAGAIGLLMFVVSLAAFSITMGVFSSSNVVTNSSSVKTAGEVPDLTEDAELGGFHPSYYDDFDLPEDSLTADSSQEMSAEDSIEHVIWYEKQKREIESKWRKIEIERTQLEKLKYETMNLLDQRKNIEEANTVQMAKLFDSMKAEDIAAILENLPDEQVGLILMKMKKQTASKVLAAIPAERAAKIASQMMNLAEGS